jgi:hypothetical protein
MRPPGTWVFLIQIVVYTTKFPEATKAWHGKAALTTLHAETFGILNTGWSRPVITGSGQFQPVCFHAFFLLLSPVRT